MFELREYTQYDKESIFNNALIIESLWYVI